MNTSNPRAIVTPLLHCDFNMPTKNGLHICLPNELVDVEIGQRVLFGSVSDDVLAYGFVRAFKGGKLGVVYVERDGDFFYPSEVSADREATDE